MESAATQNHWPSLFDRRPLEFRSTPLSVVAGAIPAGLRGTLYKNGPAVFRRGDDKLSHWFDGNGAILSLSLAGGFATGTYQIVRTPEFLEEEAKDRFLYPSFGSTARSGLKKSGLLSRTSANVHVLPWGDRLAALMDGFAPFSVHPTSLEPLGYDGLGFLKRGEPLFAHSRTDPSTGMTYHFNISRIPGQGMNIFAIDSERRLTRRARLKNNGRYLHDFAIVGPYLVFAMAPVFLEPDLGLLFGRKPIAKAINWRPECGFRWVVVDREKLDVVCEIEGAPSFCWHLGKGEHRDGKIHLTALRYESFALQHQWHYEVPSGTLETTEDGATAHLYRYVLDLRNKRVSEEAISNHSHEFPGWDVNPIEKADKNLFLVRYHSTSELCSTISKMNTETGEERTLPLDPKALAGEPLIVPDANDPSRRWLLTVVYDPTLMSSQLYILNSEAIDSEPPRAIVQLPTAIPPGFHGTWLPA